jgi:CYTH domain-containing protein
MKKHTTRKFLVASLPEVGRIAPIEITRVYPLVENGIGTLIVQKQHGGMYSRVKVRLDPASGKKSGSYTRLSRQAIDDRDLFTIAEAFAALAGGRKVQLQRYPLTGPGKVRVYLDDFHRVGAIAKSLPRGQKFWLARVEFSDRRDARLFRKLPWMGDEVTDDPRYATLSLATNGVPRP